MPVRAARLVCISDRPRQARGLLNGLKSAIAPPGETSNGFPRNSVILAGPFSDARSTAAEVKRLIAIAGNTVIALLPKGAGSRGRFLCLAAGAQECIQLDWSAPENRARIRAVLRRADRAPSVSDGPGSLIRNGALECDAAARTAKIDGENLRLTAKEFSLLLAFAQNPDRVLDRPFLIDRVWGYDYFGSPRTVDVHVRRLRGKLGAFGRRIITVPCAGYRLAPRPEAVK